MLPSPVNFSTPQMASANQSGPGVQVVTSGGNDGGALNRAMTLWGSLTAERGGQPYVVDHAFQGSQSAFSTSVQTPIGGFQFNLGLLAMIGVGVYLYLKR